jgi:hypothetical protein
MNIIVNTINIINIINILISNTSIRANLIIQRKDPYLLLITTFAIKFRTYYISYYLVVAIVAEIPLPLPK